jgi:aryl sulfotransferase
MAGPADLAAGGDLRAAGQRHRRFIKTYTPLDGVPVDPRATYIVTGGHPLDSAVSLSYQGENINRARQRQLTQELTGRSAPTEPEKPRKPVRDWLLDWIDNDATPRQEMDSIRGVLWHQCDAWARRCAPNIVLIHYADLGADLDGQMRQLAIRLGISVPDSAWPGLVEAASFASMRAAAEKITGSGRILKSAEAFFRRGTSGAGASCSVRASWRTTTHGPRNWPRRTCCAGCTVPSHPDLEEFRP